MRVAAVRADLDRPAPFGRARRRGRSATGTAGAAPLPFLSKPSCRDGAEDDLDPVRSARRRRGARPAAPARLPPGTIVTPSGLRIETLKPGTGPTPGPGDAVLIDYVGRLASGKIFDQAQHAGMMVSNTVPGFAEALQQMRKGGTYRVWIPPQLAYGAEGAGDGAIPPNSTLDFTITLVDIGRPAPQPQPR